MPNVENTDLLLINREGVDYKVSAGELVSSGPPGDKGDDGDAATVTVGDTYTGAAGTDAKVINRGTTSAAILEFTIPKGDKGDKGEDATSTLDVKDRLQKADAALQALKTAAASATDFTSLQSAIVTALADI
jgi:hypothetical protein